MRGKRVKALRKMGLAVFKLHDHDLIPESGYSDRWGKAKFTRVTGYDDLGHPITEDYLVDALISRTLTSGKHSFLKVLKKAYKQGDLL